MAFGIDLHWMAHVQGALALAEIIKRFHPNTPVILGGLSATYYHEEILVNILLSILWSEEIQRRSRCSNSSKRSKQEKISKIFLTSPIGMGRNGIQVNPLTYVPENLNDITIDYRHIMKKVVRYVDPTGYQPFIDWYTYPVTAVFTCRGCTLLL